MKNMAEEEPVLAATGISRRYGQHQVLDHIDLSVGSGEAVALVGPNGAGKSTLLRCVTGLERPDSGSVSWQGRPLAETDPRVRAGLAAAGDGSDFFPDLSVFEHVQLVASAHAVADPVAAAHAVVAEVGLAEQAEQLPPTLSQGQRRRLGLALALGRPRRLLGLDEPEQRLDVAGRGWLAEKLRAEKESGGAVLFASHDGDLVAAVADRQIVLAARS